jgi:hypothetical protein
MTDSTSRRRDSAISAETELIETKIWTWAREGCLTPKETGPVTVASNITLILVHCKGLETSQLLRMKQSVVYYAFVVPLLRISRVSDDALQYDYI